MPKSLGRKLEKVRSQQQIKPHQWQGRVNYHSPRAAESWDSPDRLLSFDGQSREGAQKVMEAYRQHVLAERGIAKPSEGLDMGTLAFQAGKTHRGITPIQSGASRLSPFEEAFRVSPDENAQQADAPRSWLKRLFSRK